MQEKIHSFHFGEKIRHIRELKGMTLKIVAQEAGVSESLVSQIERNKVSPAIETLLSLADVLDIDLEYLFEEYKRERPVRVIKADKRRVIEEENITYEEVLHPQQGDGDLALEAYIVTIPPEKQTRKGSYGHHGREMGIILEGSAVLHHENKIYELNKGDTISFSAASPHTLCNTGSIPLKAFWIVLPPQRFTSY